MIWSIAESVILVGKDALIGAVLCAVHEDLVRFKTSHVESAFVKGESIRADQAASRGEQNWLLIETIQHEDSRGFQIIATGDIQFVLIHQHVVWVGNGEYAGIYQRSVLGYFRDAVTACITYQQRKSTDLIVTRRGE
jgi:hypothetical protein